MNGRRGLIEVPHTAEEVLALAGFRFSRGHDASRRPSGAADSVAGLVSGVPATRQGEACAFSGANVLPGERKP